MTESCNSTCNQGSCSDNSSYADLISAQAKLLSILTATEANLDTFSSSLLNFCQTEQLNLTNINTKMQTVIDVNSECCTIVNEKLQELIVVLEGIEDCNTYCNIDGEIECNI